MTYSRSLVILCLAALQLGWLGGGGPIADGNRLFEEGKYDEAAQRYGEALIDAPASDVAHFNLAAAQYKQGKLAEAIDSLAKVAAPDSSPRAARVAYNLGNAHFRRGRNAAESDPQAAIGAYEQALLAYKRAMGADPGNEDAKFNHEFVQKELDDLKRKLEEQQQEQPPEEQPQEQPQEQPPEEQQQEQTEEQQDEGEQQQPDEQAQQEEDEQQAGEEEQAPEEQEQQQEAGGAGESEEDMDRQQAAAVIDTARAEELSPEEIDRTEGRAVTGAPLRDW